jgi:hypothetical protein
MRNLFLVPILLVTTPAFAHPGGHGHLNLLEIAAHVASEPFHALAVLAGVGLAFGLGIVLLRRKAAAKAAARSSGRFDNEAR